MSERCARHDLAKGPDGLCALCRRDLQHAGEVSRVRQSDRLPRLIAKLVLGGVAGVATFFLMLALFDTSNTTEDTTPSSADGGRG